MPSKEGIIVTGIWVRSMGKYIEVLAEIDGEWRVVIREFAPLDEMTISHIVEPSGMKKAPVWR